MEDKQEVTLDDAFNMVIGHMQHSNYRVAELILNDILKSCPDHADSHYMLSLCKYHLGDMNNAIKSIEEALKTDEPQAEWWCNYGIMLTESGRLNEAVKAYDSAIEVDPKYDNSYWNKSHAYFLNEMFAEAEEAARTALKINDKCPEAWLNLGTALVRTDRTEEAAEAWEKALELRPEFTFAWCNLGNAQRELGKLKESEESCRKSIEIDPNYPEGYNNLGNAVIDQGKVAEAEECYRKAIALKPDYAEAHNNLAICMINQNRLEEAIAHARYAISFNPNYFEAHINLGVALRSIGEVEEAEKAIQKAVYMCPDSPEVHIELADLLFMRDRYGDAEIELMKAKDMHADSPRLYLKLSNVLERGNKTEEALEAVSKAVELNPEMPDAYLRKGSICHIANRPIEAKEMFEKALELNPEMISARISLAELYQSLGDVEAAKEEMAAIKEKAKNIPSYYYTLGKTRKFKEDDEDFKQMQEMAKNIDRYGLEQSCTLNFALFSAYEDIGDYKKAFEHLAKGNEFKRKLVPYDADRQKDGYKQIREQYTKEKVEILAKNGCKSDVPVLIVGMPRSGTTLTEQIISSHKDVYGAGELLELGMLDLEFGPLNDQNSGKQGQWYVDQVQKKADKKDYKRITDKMPGNYSNIGKILSILPNAKIIHCRRNPVDTCLSCFKQNFARGQYWSYNLEELGDYYNTYLNMMDYWRNEFPDSFLEINYEETVSELEPRAKALIDYVDLPWDEACLEPHKQKRSVLTASKMQVIKPVYKTSMQAWKRYEKELEPLLESLSKGPAKDLI